MGKRLIDHISATYLWLKSRGFDEYAFQFVRYNIPFYALPLVNFFIINEMGFTKHNQKLLTALTKLKFSPSYNVKGIALRSDWRRCWLMSIYII